MIFVVVAYFILSPASVVSSSNHHSIFRFTDLAATSVVVVRSFSFKASSFRMDRADTALVKQSFLCVAYFILSLASVVSSSNHHSLFRFTDLAVTDRKSVV